MVCPRNLCMATLHKGDNDDDNNNNNNNTEDPKIIWAKRTKFSPPGELVPGIFTSLM